MSRFFLQRYYAHNHGGKVVCTVVVRTCSGGLQGLKGSVSNTKTLKNGSRTDLFTRCDDLEFILAIKVSVGHIARAIKVVH